MVTHPVTHAVTVTHALGSYPVHIETVALGRLDALLAAHLPERRVAVVADTEDPTPPCGSCRQILWEFAGDIEVILANLQRETARHRMSELLPLPFDARLL